MARQLRVEVAGGLYHVIVRGNERKSLFRDDADREWYLARVASYRRHGRVGHLFQGRYKASGNSQAADQVLYLGKAVPAT